MEKNEILNQLATKEISKNRAYKMLYQTSKPRKLKRAHFLKMKIRVPDSRGTNIFLRVLFLFPIPVFIVTFFLKRISKDKLPEHIDLSKEDIVNLVKTKGISLDVKTKDKEHILIKTI